MSKISRFMPQLSVVVPCFNESECINEFYRRASAACQAADLVAYEIVFVNDGSTDGTLDILQKIQASDDRVRVVDLSRNHGHQLASTAGLTVARGEMVLLIDADLQDPPELLGEMIELLEQGADVVYGRRMRRHGETLFKRCTAALFYRLLYRSSKVVIPLDTGDFRLMRRHVVEILNQMSESHRFIRGLVAWTGFDQVELPYERDPRYAGSTKYPFLKMLNFSIDAFTAFATAPLRYVFLAALLAMVVAGAMLGWTVYSYFFLEAVEGWASLMAVFLFFTSVQLLSLAVIGEYVGRIFIEAKKRPTFVIRKIYETPATRGRLLATIGETQG
jgi:polyisoprenyl-phosphate glycosyltransferase